MHSRRAFTLIEVMIVVTVISSLAAIAVPNLLSARRTANEAFAKSTIRALSTASEIYVTQHHSYPASVTDLADVIVSAPAYCADASGSMTEVRGYNFACTLASNGYTFSAAPASTSQGTVTYTGTTGGILTPI